MHVMQIYGRFHPCYFLFYLLKGNIYSVEQCGWVEENGWNIYRQGETRKLFSSMIYV